MSRRVFVTGVSGFVGRHLAKALTKRGDFVVGLERDLKFRHAPAERPDVAALVPGDLGDIQTLERILSEYDIDAVVHLAAQTEIHTAGRDPVGTFETNIRGTWNVLEACRRQNVKRVLVASSDKAYGHTLPPYADNSPFAPDRPYETSKACADMIATTYGATFGMGVAVTRCTNLFGKGQYNWTTLIARTIRRVLNGKPPILRGGGLMSRDWLYIDDAIRGYVALLDSDYVGAMNFGWGQSISVKQIVGEILDLMQSEIEPVIEEDKHGEISHQWSDCTAALGIGWRPKVLLRDGLLQTIRWVREVVAEEAKA